MAKKIYISLPISHYDLEERKAYAQKVEDTLKCFYSEVVNPLKNGIGEKEHWSVHMKKDIQDLLTCDAIYMCEDWEWSKGCKLEHDIATTCGLEVKYERDSWKPNILTEMDYTQYYCKECLFHFYDPFARGRCSHPDVACLISPHCGACFRFKMKGTMK